MTSTQAPRRPTSLLVAVGASVLAAAFLIGMAVLSVVAGKSTIAVGVGLVLVAWAGIVGIAAYGLWRLRPWARGPVVAAGLLHLLSFASFAVSEPAAWAGAACGLAAAVGAVWPSTTRALRLPA